MDLLCEQKNIIKAAQPTVTKEKEERKKEETGYQQETAKRRDGFLIEMVALCLLFQSLTERINKLLKDRKILLISNKEEVEKLEREKVSVRLQLVNNRSNKNMSGYDCGHPVEQKCKVY